MKTFKLLFIAFVAMTGLTCCSKDCGHDFIEHDYSKDILGTWSIIGPDYAEALVINADGTMDLTACTKESISRRERVTSLQTTE